MYLLKLIKAQEVHFFILYNNKNSYRRKIKQNLYM